MKTWLAEFGAGLALGLRGLVAKEMRSRSRGWRPMWLLTAYLLALTAVVAGFLSLIERGAGTLHPAMGLQAFSTLAVTSVLLLAFITPALTVGAVSGERERRTLDLLLITRASALGLVSGKLAGSLVYILFLLAAALPAFALVYLFGGVPWLNLAMTLAVAAVTAITHAALGLLLSTLLRRTALASVVAYLVVLLLVFGLPFVAAVSAFARQPVVSDMAAGGPPPAYLYASPLASVSSVLPSGQYGWGLPIVVDLGFIVTGGRYAKALQPAGTSIGQAVHIVGSNPSTGEPITVVTWAPWVYHFAISGVVTLASLLLAALVIRPIKPWHTWRATRRPRPAASEARTA